MAADQPCTPDPPTEAEVMNAWLGVQADTGPESYANDRNDFHAWLTQVKDDAAEARLARLRALLDQIEHTQHHANISIDRVRRALGDVTP